MSSLVKVLCIERQAKAKGDARSEFYIVGESSNSPVVYLTLTHTLRLAMLKQKGIEGIIPWQRT